MPNKAPPLNVMRGLHEALVAPIAKDFENAYWIQRAARGRYPAGDAALNFVPYVGLAANVDDMAHASDAGDMAGAATGAAVNGSLVTGYAGAGMAAVKRMAQEAPGQVGRAAVLLSAGPLAYLRSVLDAQKAANNQYGDIPLVDLAARLRGWGQP